MLFLPPEVMDQFYRMLVAALFGGLVGLERDIHGRAAGLRTHLLVSLGSAVFMILSEIVGASLEGAVFDPSRIAAQIVTGIGFLGAGVIIKAGVNVRGLTTAACLWTAAGIGMAAGAGFFTLSGLTTVIALISLIALKAFEKIYSKDFYRVLRVTTPIRIQTQEIGGDRNRKNIGHQLEYQKKLRARSMYHHALFEIAPRGAHRCICSDCD